MNKTEIARQLRQQQTPAENTMWQLLRRKQLAGYKFYRQKPILGFVTDFCCISSRLIIELDGCIHQKPEVRGHDAERQAILEGAGYRFLRFTNEQVFQTPECVTEKILDFLAINNPPLAGEGGPPKADRERSALAED
ncbi:MAG: endonuclease domain-containing protein [Candidatus Melainabacteria bacterium]